MNAPNWRHVATVVTIALALFLVSVLISCQNQSSGPGASLTSVMAAAEEQGPTTQESLALGFSFPPSPTRLVASSRTTGDVSMRSQSCLICHSASDSFSMHDPDDIGARNLSCVDCHGGHPDVPVPVGIARSDPNFNRWREQAHVSPTKPQLWSRMGNKSVSLSAANPIDSGAATLAESADYIRFVNPGDLRSARVACASCHAAEVDHVQRSMMAHGAMLWGAALYNNGAINRKTAVYGESYSSQGLPQRILPAHGSPTTRTAYRPGWLAALWPLPRWEVSQPGNVLRVFEAGGRRRPIVGIPDPDEDPGNPDVKLSVRGFGTDVRTDPVFLGLQKTRLLDPTLALIGTNDHPGDYRASGCSACHVLYANDRSPVHSGLMATLPGRTGPVQLSDFGNRGYSFSGDRMVSASTQPTNTADRTKESGHPIGHSFVRSVPTSTCIVCHVHPGTNVVNSFTGFTWWDNEIDGQYMYPKSQQYPSAQQRYAASEANPEGAAARGLWSDLYPNLPNHMGQIAGPNFLEDITRLNDVLPHTQFADFHGHGWVYRAVFKQDRHGTLLNSQGKPLAAVTPQQMQAAVALSTVPLDQGSAATQPTPPSSAAGSDIPVHLKDIHLEKGMQCVDCHFAQDSHGDGNLYGETRNAVMIECVDCHGSAEAFSPLNRYMTGSGSYQRSDAGKDLLAKMFSGNAASKTPDLAERKDLLNRHFDTVNGRLWQKSAMDPKKGWFVVETRDTIIRDSWWAKDAASSHDRARVKDATAALYAHTIRQGTEKGNPIWGGDPATDLSKPGMMLAHADARVSCSACHSAWNTSCFGCHLSMKANEKKDMLHNEGVCTRNYTTYNFQTIRDDIYMLGNDSSAKGGKVVPVRSACAVLVSSQDANRQWIYSQQQTISAEGFSGTSFSPYFPHTVRARETKQCSDCHIHRDANGLVDNNAIMAQLLMLGTNAVNFIGHYAWVGEGPKGLQAVAVTEQDEPQAVIGSRLHSLAYPDFYQKHQENGLYLTESYGHEGTVLDLQLRGEYLYAACGSNGFIAYDVANVFNKGFSERIITAPVSPLGQRLYVKSKYATCICSPSTLAIDPTRSHLPENEEGRIHPLYKYLYLTDRDEGLIVIGNPDDDKVNKPGVATLLDGDPTNNFLTRALTWNPGRILAGARYMALYGHYAYVCCDAGLAVVDLDDPLHPVLKAMMKEPDLHHTRRIAFQFRYAFVCDDDGVKVLEITQPDHPMLVPHSAIALGDARDIYLCRTYAYVAAGREGVVIIDIEKPEAPRIYLRYSDGGSINDATAVRVGMTNSSLYAYVADGRNGLRVLQLTSDQTPGFLGYSPPLQPQVIARFRTKGPAIALSKGLDRDRAVDESGNQLSVFGRRGARPFNLVEQQKLYLRSNADGSASIYTENESDAQTTEPRPGPTTQASNPAKTAPAAPRLRFPPRH